MERSATSTRSEAGQNDLYSRQSSTVHVMTKAPFTKVPRTPEVVFGSSPQSVCSVRSSKESMFSTTFTHPEGSPQSYVLSLASTPVHQAVSPRAEYIVGHVTATKATTRKQAPRAHHTDALCTCAGDDPFAGPENLPPDSQPMFQVPGAAGGGGGNTLVSIPIPVSVPMPMGQAGGGSQGGPIVITSPPPPAPPNPPLPPYPPTPRPGIAQDVASMLMVLLMNHVRERIDGTSPDIRSQQRLRDEEVAAAAANAAVEALNKAQLPKEPMVPAWMFRELLPVGGRRSSVDLDKQKKKKKLKKRKDDGPLEAPETPPPLVLPFSVPDADTQVPPSVQIEKIPAESPEESSILKPEESPEEEEETMTGTFRVPVPFCDLIGCYLMVILLLGSIVAINVAFMIAPEEVTNFFCELGVGENASKQAHLYAAEANNSTGSQPSDESSGMLRVSARSDKSIFDIEEPELGDDEPIPRRIGIDPVEQSSLTHSASEVTLPEFVKSGFTARERCSTGKD